MGAALLIGRGLAVALAGAALLLAPTGGGLAAQDPGGGGDADPHEGLACATCHRTSVAGREVGGVPEAACTEAGCHQAGGPARVTVSTVTFRHRDHADTASVEPGCAGCHGHASGGEPITPTLATCALCHAEQITADRPEACRTCHREPRHVPVTNQGVPVPHADLPWIVEGCTRCHYDVDRPRTSVSVQQCGSCHTDLRRITAEGIGTDLHPRHEGVGCVSCHERNLHRVVAMSSSVRLECGACHTASHGSGLLEGRSSSRSAVCTSCHRSTHAGQQRMVLGIVTGLPVTPAYKFRSGLTCGSCHTDEGGGGGPRASVTSTVARACTGCHRQEYARVLTWWEEGAAQRLRRARGYRAGAVDALRGAAPDSAPAHLARAEELLALVENAGASHNVQMADAVLRESVDRVRAAYRAAGRQPPAAPEMGRRPRVGFCSYCHYRIGEPTGFDEVPADFHEEVTRRMERLRRRDGG
jgi:hypothetical protein